MSAAEVNPMFAKTAGINVDASGGYHSFDRPGCSGYPGICTGLPSASFNTMVPMMMGTSALAITDPEALPLLQGRALHACADRYVSFLFPEHHGSGPSGLLTSSFESNLSEVMRRSSPNVIIILYALTGKRGVTILNKNI